MKRKKRIFLLIIVVLFIGFILHGQKDPNPTFLSGPYLGQSMPGMIPEYFAPGIVTTKYHEHSPPAISPDGKWVFWSVFLGPLQSPAPQVILYVKLSAGRWSKPKLAPFSGQYMDGGPCISTDGQKLFFGSCRPLDGKGEPKDWDIWYVNRIDKGWGRPINLGSPVNSDKDESQPSITRDGTLYFISQNKDYKYNICISRARFLKDRYQRPEILAEPINQKGTYAWCPFIAADESYLLFVSERKHHLGFGDIYISYRRQDDTWNEPVNLGEPVCSKFQDRFPGISPDGKVLFFSSKRRTFGTYFKESQTLDTLFKIYGQPGNGLEDIYWVDAKIIEDLKPKELKSKE